MGGTSALAAVTGLFVHKVVNIFFCREICIVWSSLICTPSATQTNAKINHSGLSLNQCELPVVGSWASSTCFSLAVYISEICVIKTGVFALQHVSTTKLKKSVGFVGRFPFFLTRSCKASMASCMESNRTGNNIGSGIGEFSSLVLGTATLYCINFSIWFTFW